MILDPKLGGKLRLAIKVLALAVTILAAVESSFPGWSAVAVASGVVTTLLSVATHLSSLGNAPE